MTEQERHDAAVREVTIRYGKLCRWCYHVDTHHAAFHQIDNMDFARGGCNFCDCDQFLPLSPLDICELVEAMKNTNVTFWYAALKNIFKLVREPLDKKGFWGYNEE